jgi:hypothetical protein
MIDFICPCGKQYSVANSAGGKYAECYVCKEKTLLPSPRPAIFLHKKPNKAILFLSLFLILGAGAALWIAHKGKGVSPGLYEQKNKNFAFYPLEGWKLSIEESVEPPHLAWQEMEKNKSLFQINKKRKGHAVTLTKPSPDEARLSPIISVLAFPIDSPLGYDITENNSNFLAKLYEPYLVQKYVNYKKEAQIIFNLENIKALRLEGKGQFHQQAGQFESEIHIGQDATLHLKKFRIDKWIETSIILVIILGAETAYTISFHCDSAEYNIYLPEFEKFLSSFSVTERITPMPLFSLYKGWLGWLLFGLMATILSWAWKQ